MSTKPYHAVVAYESYPGMALVLACVEKHFRKADMSHPLLSERTKRAIVGALREMEESPAYRGVLPFQAALVPMMRRAVPDPSVSLRDTTLVLEDSIPIVREILSRGHPDFNTFYVTAYSMVRSDLAGRKVYEPSDVLAQKLANTKLKGVRFESLKLPYSAVTFHVPKTSGLTMPAEFGKATYPVTAMTVMEEDDLVDFDRKGSRSSGWRIVMYGGPEEDPTQDAAFLCVSFGSDPQEKVDHRINALYETIAKDGSYGKANAEAWRKVFWWVMNAVLYATFTDRGERFFPRDLAALRRKIDRAKGKKRKSLQEQFRARSRKLPAVIRIGRNERWESREAKDLPSKRGESLRTRMLVAGHWRNVPCGKGRRDRRLKWISPYWRGPEDGIVVNPRHVMSA